MWKDVYIQNDVRVNLEISWLDYAVLDLIHKSKDSNGYSDIDGYYKPGCRKIAKFLGEKKSAVNDSLIELKEKGLIELNDKGHRRATARFTELIKSPKK